MKISCMFCKMLNRKNSNEKGEVWCELKKEFVPMISPKCEGFVSFIESEVKK